MPPAADRPPWEEWETIDRLLRWRLRPWAANPCWDDLYSEALIAVWEGLHGESPYALTTRIVYYCDRAVRRFQARREAEAGRWAPLEAGAEAPPPDRTGRIVDRIAGRRFYEWMERHSQGRQRAIVQAVYRDGLTHAAAAARLGVHLNTVQRQLTAILARCRTAFGIEAPARAEPAHRRVRSDAERARWNEYLRAYRCRKKEETVAKLTTKERKKIPAEQFGLPDQRAYPMPDKSHAANAKARAAQFASPAEKAKIDRKADRVLRGK